MNSVNLPIKQGLFSALVNHEVGQSEINSNESSQGLRPRLPNRFEVLDTNIDTPSIEEQQSETSITSPKTNNREESSESIGLRTTNLPIPHENSFQHKETINNPIPSLEPTHTLRPHKNQLLESEAQLGRIRTENHVDKLPSINNRLKPLNPGSLQTNRTIEDKQEKPIAEQSTIVERETLREIHALKPSLPETRRQTGLMPKMQPVQAFMSPLKEKASQPNIEIHIGRIEVRANTQESQTKPDKMTTSVTNDNSLQFYLQSRSRGARS
ncbi:MAG: hypothetical protein ABL925_03620 [Methylococcales bacterium]